MTAPQYPGAPFPQGQNPQPPYPIPPAPQKKTRKWPWVVGVLVALAVIGGIAGGENDDTPPTSTAAGSSESAGAPAAPAAAPAVDEPLPGIGAPVRDGKFEFTITNVETGLTALGDNPFLAKEAQGQFVVVTMSVLNTSDEPKGVSPDNQEMFDAQGRKFTADTAAALNLDTDIAFWDEINPGNAVTLKVVYDMPADAIPAEMELHDSMFSGGVTVSLR